MSDIQPLQNRVQIVKDDGTPTDFFIRWAKQRQIDISGGITAIEAQALIDAWALARDVNAGVGLSGGGNLSTDITVDLENTTVTPGSYNSADITVDAQGRITAAANGAGGTPLEVEDEGVSVETATTKINFLGAGVTATNPAAGEVDVTIPGDGSALGVEDEGVSIETATTVIDFVGAGVTVTSTAAGEVEVNIASSGAAWTLISTVNPATTAAVDFTGLGAYGELMVIVQDVTASISGVRQIVASTNNGATFFSSSGNYVSIPATGVPANVAEWAAHSTNTTAARTFIAVLEGLNVLGAPKLCTLSGSTSPRLFVADNANNVDAIRVNNSTGGTINAGTIYLYGR